LVLTTAIELSREAKEEDEDSEEKEDAEHEEQVDDGEAGAPELSMLVVIFDAFFFLGTREVAADITCV